MHGFGTPTVSLGLANRVIHVLRSIDSRNTEDWVSALKCVATHSFFRASLFFFLFPGCLWDLAHQFGTCIIPGLKIARTGFATRSTAVGEPNARIPISFQSARTAIHSYATRSSPKQKSSRLGPPKSASTESACLCRIAPNKIHTTLR